jgi:hypothetical protein
MNHIFEIMLDKKSNKVSIIFDQNIKNQLERHFVKTLNPL